MNRRAVFIIGLLLGITAGGAMLRAIFASNPATFDSYAWQTIETEADYEKRAAMLRAVTDMLKARRLPTKPDVRRVLGPSDRNIAETEDKWIYLLTPDRQAATDNRYLEITFDADGNVTTFNVRESNETVREVDAVNEPKN